ncbi:helix-turn-helix domain-containing protein [Pedobacter petrophilus]|uniref:Helix-turn-helix domain-containing protein n=1 Tax=Pedobacter petrophilus TaxID=1908241 RepID=A0A7K0G3W7_9SPHI|nr:helix-turn-helix transcriptional regulator [Pedobacter petrophilus]MRX78401.1 helix-turn-helix domain-containing protein [Pedobacter petrophilus]
MKHIREKLGLSQIDMGSLLGMPRSSASMYEIGLRNLNHRQLALLSKIEMLMQGELEIKPFEEIKTKAQQNTAVMIKNMEQRIDKAVFDCLKLQRKLTALIADYTKTELLWGIISRLKEETPERTPLMVYLDLLEIRCLEKIDKCGPHQQAEIIFRIKTLEHEQALAQTMIEEAKLRR